MKIKLVIMKKDRNNKVAYATKKNRKGDLVDLKEGTYRVGGDHFQITRNWRKAWRRNYVTYYYKEGCPDPLPVPLFDNITTIGITAEELQKIFTPTFYQIIAGPRNKLQKDIIFYIMVGCLIVSVYTAWQIMTLPDKLVAAGLT